MPYYMILNCVISYYIILEYYVKLYFTYIYIYIYIYIYMYVNQLGDYNRTIPEEPQHREAGDLAEAPIKT